MCEHHALCFNEPTLPYLYKTFRERSVDHPDGWGFAYYIGKGAQVIKEPVKALESPLSEYLSNYGAIKSNIILAHVRKTSVGNNTFENTHPFTRELNGTQWVFQHHGTLVNHQELPLGRFKPMGITDSEHIFCHILKNLEENTSNNWDDAKFNWLIKILNKVDTYGKFNCLLTNGSLLFTYWGQNKHISLKFLRQTNPALGYAIATRALTDEQWEDFLPGELIVFEKGKMIFSNMRKILE